VGFWYCCCDVSDQEDLVEAAEAVAEAVDAAFAE
jgi:hypothetical protein